MNDKSGKQSIGCDVTNCQYHSQGACDLNQITVQPCTAHGSTGDSTHETLCGSFRSTNR